MSFPKGQKRNFQSLERRRMKAARFFARGMQPAEVARRCRVSCQSATRWLASWKKGGLTALKKAPRAGRPPRLSPDNLQKLKVILKQSRDVPKRNGGTLSASGVAALIKNRFGVQYHPDHVCRILGQMGWTHRRSATRSYTQAR
jgi:transposase